jgi:hypothetical protein
MQYEITGTSDLVTTRTQAVESITTDPSVVDCREFSLLTMLPWYVQLLLAGL